jgi:hypothetical protein
MIDNNRFKDISNNIPFQQIYTEDVVEADEPIGPRIIITETSTGNILLDTIISENCFNIGTIGRISQKVVSESPRRLKINLENSEYYELSEQIPEIYIDNPTFVNISEVVFNMFARVVGDRRVHPVDLVPNDDFSILSEIAGRVYANRRVTGVNYYGADSDEFGNIGRR